MVDTMDILIFENIPKKYEVSKKGILLYHNQFKEIHLIEIW